MRPIFSPSRAPAARVSLLTGESDPMVAAEVDAWLGDQWRLGVQRDVQELARGDEKFRRRLLKHLKNSGARRRGGFAPADERAKLAAAFYIVRLILSEPGKATSDYAAAQYIAERTALYPNIDPATLLRRFTRQTR